jgi:hypothetical protein
MCCVLAAVGVLGCGGTETKDKPPEATKGEAAKVVPAEPAKDKGKAGTNAPQGDLSPTKVPGSG